MAGDIEQRLTAAAEAVREHDMTGLRAEAPRERIDILATDIDNLRVQYDKERRDIFTDLAVRDRIKAAQEGVVGAEAVVHTVRERLAQRAVQAHGRLDAITDERHAILTA